MSAIAGVLHVNQEPIEKEHISKMMEPLKRYPADNHQIWRKDKVFFGCHDQWMTPESIREPLPYYDKERRLAITADAIIDNRQELFDLLLIDRRIRGTMPDSLLILNAYDKWGENCPQYLIGDFAFMIWDERQMKLFGARDFSGTRTLYFFCKNKRFAFCTLIEPLLALSYSPRKLNEEWLAEYLAITGMIDSADATLTPYEHIQQLPPSHSISVTREKLDIKRYCTVTSVKPLHLKSDDEYVEAFQEVFQLAIDSKLRTHHKVGSQLSGGLDSGAVVSFAAKSLQKENKRLHTLSYIPVDDFIDYTPKQLVADERPFIEATVNYVGGMTDNYFDFQGKDSYSEIDDMLAMTEMPYKFLENSFWLKGMFEKAQEKGLGILLNGDRGNYSISWGSAMHYYAILLKKVKVFQLYRELNDYCKQVGGARLRRIPLIAKIGFPILNELFSSEKQWQLPPLIRNEFAEQSGVYTKLKQFGIDRSGWFSRSNIYKERKQLYENIFPWNSGNAFTCKLSVRYGLWKRDPTNDLRVVRFCLSVPEEQYVQNGIDRSLIRRATKHYLPDKVRLNQRLRGVQGADWIHRMIPHWKMVIEELERMSRDERILFYIDDKIIHEALIKTRQGPKAELATDPDYKNMMRSLIVYRFIQTFA
ncbi:asparagine synthase-related protein [Evansella halocellulosilytica]|uniref:asparagine synthase-related protein n=1 Tax=Evansella halocellulosilytica TaxID=2011013 RepID=UPI000BB828B4|nr:asparagine synthase-related protein [Evansella halocellulosilytica]